MTSLLLHEEEVTPKHGGLSAAVLISLLINDLQLVPIQLVPAIPSIVVVTPQTMHGIRLQQPSLDPCSHMMQC